MKQRVISFEGIDGSGKSTYVRRLVDILKRADYDVFTPQYDEWEKDRKVDVKSLPDDVAFFYHLSGTILEEQKFVQNEFEKHDFTILDRGLDTNIVYSHLFSKLVRKRSFYDGINLAFLTSSRVPDLTFWVCTPVEVALERIRKTRESVEFYETEKYLTELDRLFNQACVGILPPYDVLNEHRWYLLSGVAEYEKIDQEMEEVVRRRLLHEHLIF
jgi:thymidylate kinase